jgi:hypothetical protein
MQPSASNTARDPLNRRTRFARLEVPVLLAVLVLATPPQAASSTPPWQQTEVREPCSDFAPMRNPYFGETHILSQITPSTLAR